MMASQRRAPPRSPSSIKGASPGTGTAIPPTPIGITLTTPPSLSRLLRGRDTQNGRIATGVPGGFRAGSPPLRTTAESLAPTAAPLSPSGGGTDDFAEHRRPGRSGHGVVVGHRPAADGRAEPGERR